MRYIIYNENGKILKNIFCLPDLIELQLSEGQAYLEVMDVVDDSMFYVYNVSVAERPSFSETVKGTVVSNLPTPTTVRVEGTTYEVLDGTAELYFSLPGAYQVDLESFPYRDKTIEVVQQ